MGLLAPLYLAGLLAIGIPILLHLIRRTPQGRQFFSSLMFLDPSPPRLTKRSRLTNILLLLMRAMALVLLALAFARPFFHWNEEHATPSSGRRIIFLVDVSASMRRSGVWEEARQKVDAGLANVKPADEVGLYIFDRQLRPVMTMAEWNQTDPAARLSLFRAKFGAVSPGWSATRLGDALAAAADLASENNSAAGQGKIFRQIILIADMQQGGKVEALQGHEWPKEVSVWPLPVTARQPGNASLQWAPSTAGQTTTDVGIDGTLRVNVANQSDSTHEQFTLRWAGEKGALPGEPIAVYVAPGRNQVVKVPLPPDEAGADRLVLAGDECDFDNTLFIVPPRSQTLRVLYVGDDPATDPNGLRYFLQNALFDTPQRKVEFIARDTKATLTDADLLNTRLALVTAAPPEGMIAPLRSYVQNGGDLLWVCKDLATAKAADALFGRNLSATEATADYVLLSRVELTHPLFTPFADPRFADFTKIHFWKHRQIKWTDAPDGPPIRVLAAFDDGFPYLLEQTIGSGTARLMASGWQPTDSQMQQSSKFLPLLDRMVISKQTITIGGQYAVDDPVEIPLEQRAGAITAPGGKVTQLSSNAAFSGGTQPGIYRLRAGDQQSRWAVNVSPDESRTLPISAEELTQWIKFTDPNSVQKLADQQRQLQSNELENQQKSWRWLLLGVLGLLAVETALAGRLSRGAFKERAAA